MTQTAYYTKALEDPESSAFSALYYDADTETAFVQFHNEDRPYTTYHLKPSEWNSWMSSSSLGRHYHTHVRGSKGASNTSAYKATGYYMIKRLTTAGDVPTDQEIYDAVDNVIEELQTLKRLANKHGFELTRKS